MISAPGEPPGSRVSSTPIPIDSSRRARVAAWVDLPVPSPPSNVMNFPSTRPACSGSACGFIEASLSRRSFIAINSLPLLMHSRSQLREYRDNAGCSKAQKRLRNHNRSTPARNRPIINSVTASMARFDIEPGPTSSAARSGTSSARLSPAYFELTDRLALSNRRGHRARVDDAGRQPFLVIAGHHHFHDAGPHQRHVARLAAKHFGFADGLALGKQDAGLETLKTPFQQLARFLGALLLGFCAGENDDQPQLILHGRTDQSKTGFGRIAGLQPVSTETHA